MKKKTITLEVKNDQLDALEDLLTAVLTDKERTKANAKAMELWLALVNAYDKPSE